MKSGNIEYVMSETMAKELLKSAKVKDHPMSDRGQATLQRLVNENLGLKGNCTSVIIK